jgi:hypothetical protein
MDWTGKTREEVEIELIARMNAFKATYEGVKVAQQEMLDLYHDIETGTPDGIVAARRAIDAARSLSAALDDYQLSLKQFTAFVVYGTLPKD